jgi:hypothetical protein
LSTGQVPVHPCTPFTRAALALARSDRAWLCCVRVSAGEAGPVARAGRRRLRRRRGPEAARQLRPRGDGAAGGKRRGRRAPLGEEAPQNEPGTRRGTAAAAAAHHFFHQNAPADSSGGGGGNAVFGCRS